MRKLSQIFIIALMLLHNTGLLFAQSNDPDYATKQYTQIPPSPEVASLMKYIDIPVSHFSGLPQINIPIYTITEGNISIPISLSYRGGGIKQHELSGIISKGWSLSSGMTISRNVYGLPDDYICAKGMQNEIRGFFHLQNKDKELRTKIIGFEGDYDPTMPDDRTAYTDQECQDYENGYVDFANDIFKFYGLGYSGTFIFDQNQNMTLSTGSPITFSQNNWKSCDYEIVDKDQTKYFFGIEGLETTIVDKNAYASSENDSLEYISAWHVTKITDIHNNVIEFTYSEPIYISELVGHSQYYIYYSKAIGLTDSQKTSSHRSRYLRRNLIAIKSKSTTIKFHYNNPKNLLESISIHRNDSETSELWRYTLVRDDQKNLVKIIQCNQNNEQDLYGFTYKPKNCTAIRAVDHWGYCNGVSDNPSLLPDVNHSEIPYKIADREPNENYTKEGILTQIKYPMGGKTTLEWEQNDYSYIAAGKGYLEESTTTNISETHTYLKGKTVGQRTVVYTNDMSAGDYIRLNLGKYFGTLISSGSGLATDSFINEYSDETHYDAYPRVKIILIANNGDQVKQTYYLDSRYEKDSIVNFRTEAAKYRIELHDPQNFLGVDAIQINGYFGTGADSGGDFGYIPITIKKYSTITVPPIKPWGGLRIKRILSEYYDGSNIIKTYDYTCSNKSQQMYSSGVINMLPSYLYYSYICFPDLETKGYYTPAMTCIGSNGLYSSTDGELNIEYSEVWESYNGAYNGKIGYFYDTHREYKDYYSSNPYCETYIPQNQKTYTSLSFKRGNLNKKVFSKYLEDSNTEEIYKQIEYNYLIPTKTDNPIFTGTLYSLCDFSNAAITNDNGNYFLKSYTISEFNLIPYNKRVKSETVWEKDFFTEAESENQVTYTYYGEENGYSAYPWNSFVRSKSTENSQGQTVTTYYTYYKTGENIPLDLKELEITVVDDIVVSAKRNVYDINTHRLQQTYTGGTGVRFSTNFSIPTHIKNAATYPAIDKNEYSYTYDAQGNIVQINFNGEVLASYLWGYMGKHPIVEAQGVCYADLFNTAKQNWGYSEENYVTEANLQSLLATIRNTYAGKEVLTYTYHWLLGMATATDSRGVTNTYSLDDFGRLSNVKDTNEYFINKYDYKYKGL